MSQSTETSPHRHDGSSLRESGEWYILREDIDVGESRYRAGTPVRRLADGWLIHGIGRPLSMLLEGRVCRTEYGGLSLHVVSRQADGSLVHRRVGSDEPVDGIPDSRVIAPPECGHDRVYLAFGDQFYPPEYFGW